MNKLKQLGDWDLFAMFNIIDSCTAGKDKEPLKWFLAETCEMGWTEEDIL